MSSVIEPKGPLDAPAASPLRQLRLTSDELTCDVAETFWDVGDLQPDWDAVVETAGAPFEMTFDWCRVWWAHYGAGRDARLYVFRDQDGVAGVAPMCIDQVRFGPVGLRVAKIMGADSAPGLCDVPLREPWAETAIDELLDRLIGTEGCDAVLLGPLSDTTRRAEAVRAAARRRGDLAILRDRAVTTHAVIHLPQHFDDYVARLSRNLRHNVRKSWRRLNRDFEVKVETVADPDAVHDELNAFIEMHAAQWRGRNMLGHFGDWPGAWGFHHDLVAAMSAEDRVRLLKLRAGDTVIARQYAYVFGDLCSCRLAARDADPKWDGYGPGLLSLMNLFEDAVAEGIRTVDAGTGDYGYKRRLGGVEHKARSLLVVACHRGARRRARLVCQVADWLDRYYYKAWFCEVAPRLRVPRRPLWNSWIRSRL